jgi:hypothetical protein
VPLLPCVKCCSFCGLVLESLRVVEFASSLILGCLPQACTSSVTTIKGPLVDRGFTFGGKARGEYGAPLWQSVLCLHTTAPTESSTHRGVNFRIHRRLRVPQLLLNPISFTYALYLEIAFMLDVSYLTITMLLILLSIGCW